MARAWILDIDGDFLSHAICEMYELGLENVNALAQYFCFCFRAKNRLTF